eukprot:TRINITY_DN21671_c0_g1_i1.p1 TRINITY_DN21671_c0_g1~~TRINITY_DN21671_c0_g1_i1.p1  ORF type:complete len:598 (+),score=90.99 TRINITY_DN21671_c0_g1_i1:69-1862(+)
MGSGASSAALDENVQDLSVDELRSRCPELSVEERKYMILLLERRGLLEDQDPEDRRKVETILSSLEETRCSKKEKAVVGTLENADAAALLSIHVQVSSLAGESLFSADLPSDCYEQAAFDVIIERLQQSRAVTCSTKRCKFAYDDQVLEPRSTTTLAELAMRVGRTGPATGSVNVEVTLTVMSKLPKPELGERAQMVVDEALLEAVANLDELRVDELLTAGANAQIEHPFPWQAHQTMLPLHLAVNQSVRRDELSWRDGNGRAVILALLDDGADPSTVHRMEPGLSDNRLGTAFELALPQVLYDVGILSTFLEMRANPNTISNARREDMYEHVLHMAVAVQQLGAAKALLEAGVHVDSIRHEVVRPQRDPPAACKWSGMALTARQQYSHNLLLERYAVLRRREGAGILAPHILAETANMTALHVACAAGDLATSAWLLSHGADPNIAIRTIVTEPKEDCKPRARAKSGSTPGSRRRERSTGSKPTKATAESLSRPSSKDPRVVEETPLQLALQNGPQATPLVALLVIAGADVDRPAGTEGRTPKDLCDGSASLLGALQAKWADARVQAYFPPELVPQVKEVVCLVEARQEHPGTESR